MLRCPKCNRITKPKEATARIEYKHKLWLKNIEIEQISGQEQVCMDCYEKK